MPGLSSGSSRGSKGLTFFKKESFPGNQRNYDSLCEIIQIREPTFRKISRFDSWSGRWNRTFIEVRY